MKRNMIDEIMTIKHCVIYFDLIKLIYSTNKNTSRHDERALSFDQYDLNSFSSKTQEGFSNYRSFFNNLNYQFRYSNYVYNNQYSQS